MQTPTIIHGERKITYRFENGTDESGNRCVIDVTASHWKERKVFHASWTPKTIERLENGWAGERFEIPSGGRIMSEKVARYSQKGLDEFAARVLATYLERVEVTA
jgi:hypothetical protein